MGAYDDLMKASTLGGLGEGFVRGLNEGREQRMREIEMDAKLKSQADDRKRQEYMDRATLQEKGYTPGQGDLYSQPLEIDKAKRREGLVEKYSAHGQVPDLDENGNVVGFHYSPEYLKLERDKAQLGIQKAQALAGPRQTQANTALDNQTSHAVDAVTKDPELGKHIQRVQGANRILSQLDEVRHGKMVDTNQFLNDLNTEYVALLTGSQNPALGKQERTEYTTTAGNIAAVMQKISADPKSINSPQILKQLETGVTGLRGTYQKNVSTRAKMLQRGYKHNPDAQQAQAEKINEMIGAYGDSAEGSPQGLVKTGLVGNQKGLVSGPPAAEMSAEDKQALDWANANPNDKRAQEIKKRLGQ